MPSRQPDRPVRRHRRLRWVVAGVLALVALLAVAVRLSVTHEHSPTPLSLPAGHLTAVAGPVSGTWTAGRGSAAGFRVTEQALGASNVVVGRTAAVTGTFAADGSTVSSAAFQIRLTAIRVGGKPQQQLDTSLHISAHPVAKVRLISPLQLSPAFASGRTMHASARGMLTLNGISRPVTITLEARRDGGVIEAAGTIPVSFATYGISQPTGFGWLASLADHGTAEFLLILRPA